MFAKLFGNKEKKQAPNQPSQPAILEKLNSQVEDLETRLDYLDKQIKNKTNEAKEKLKAGDKHGAQKLLRDKKRLQDEITKSEGMLGYVEEQKYMIENASFTKNLMSTLSEGTKYLDTVKVDMDQMNDIRDKMDELKDEQAEQNEFFKEYADQGNEEIADDLEALEAEIEKENAVQLPAANTEVIQKEPAKKEKNDLDELNQMLAI